MSRFAFILLPIVLILSACQEINANEITLNEIHSSFEKQRLLLIESKGNDDHVFGMKLYGVKPSSLELEGKLLIIYIFNSTEEREKGLEDFRIKTASVNVVSYKTYEVKNVLLFYVYELNLNEEVDEKIKEALREFDNNEM